MKGSFFLGAAAALALGVAFTPQARTDIVETGFLSRFDPRGHLGKAHLVHEVRLIAGVNYEIRLKSKDFDPYLRIESSLGTFLASDDDSGGNLNARLFFRPTYTDWYRIIVTSFSSGESGTYLLLIDP